MIIFVSGGTRSGKSRFAQLKAESFEGKRTYIATAIPVDDEMKERIKIHKQNRSTEIWHELIEEPYDIPEILIKLNKKTDVVLLDCITIWLSNILLKFNDIKKVTDKIDDLIDSLKKIEYNIILVSNEVGMGIVPENKIARIFRDLSGIANQKISKISDEFYVIFSGYPLRLK